MRSLAQIAKDFGLLNGANSRYGGEGNVAELLASIADGQVALWHYADQDSLWQCITLLDQASAYDDDAFSSLANALRATARRTVE